MPPKSNRPRTVVPLAECFPTALLQSLEALPVLSESPNRAESDSEPARKRARVAADDPESHLLTRQTFAFKRPAPDGDPITQPIIRNDIGNTLKLRFRRERELPHLVLEWVRVSTKNVGWAQLEMESDLTPEQRLCSEVSLQQEPREREGAIWTLIDLSLDHVEGAVCLRVTVRLYWNGTRSPWNLRTQKQKQLSSMVLSTFFPDPEHPEENNTRQTWSPLEFYEAAFVPPPDDDAAEAINVQGLASSLYPYQKRTLQWLLHREGASLATSELGFSVCEPITGSETASPLSFSAHPAPQQPHVSNSSGDSTLQISRLYHLITKDVSQFTQLETSLKGGILSEEMGLGKTLEIIGLILLHKRRLNMEDPYVEVNGETLQRSGATLIVCPSSLQQQWLAELERHAPHLMVSYYPGRGQMGISADNPADEEELVTLLAHQDVVLTTYNVLTSELHYATKPPDRSRRRERAYARPKSPLVQISWWRVCLDEAQMIESGVSSAAIVARVLHRVNAWGVTGTPVKSDIKDLLGLLLFLRYEPYSSFSHVWAALTERYKDVFRSLFNRISIRHTKQLVRDEIALPAQKRFVITMPFTAVEQQHYQSLFNEMSEACGLDAEGDPVVEDWNPKNYEERMRSWLNRLRQAALHPEVGVQNRRALGHKAGAPLRTVDEVLTAMIEQNDILIRAEQRNYLHLRLTHGQLLENGPQVKKAQRMWLSVRAEADQLVDKCRQELTAAIEDARKARMAVRSNPGSAAEDSTDDDEDDFDDPKNRGKDIEVRLRLRSALETQHRAVFFCGNGFFQIKSNTDFTTPESAEYQALQEKEDEAYDTAKEIRREILSENHKKATSHMKRLRESANTQSFVEMPELKPNEMRGLESGPVLERAEGLYGLLNLQAGLIDEWREAIIQLLLRPLVDEEDEVELTGDEFADSTKIQEELMVYVQVLRAAIADRQMAISGLENALIRHEIQTAKVLARDGEGPAPTKFNELMDLREKVRPEIGDGLSSLKGVVAALRSILTRIPRSENASNRAEVEYAIVQRQIQDMQAQIASQTKAATALERECERFTSAMNARVDYYRQLQYVSDSVEPYEGERDEAAILEYTNLEVKSHNKLTSAEGKQRYLLSLRDTNGDVAEPRMCIICQSSFSTGVLTVCGHQFCKECIMLWFRAHHNCPMCKRVLRMSELHNITLKPRELKLHVGEDVPAPGLRKSIISRKSAIYSEFGAEKLAEINQIDLDGPSFTTKVDSIIRHLLWLRDSDPGAKSVIFSQYRDFLGVMGLALSRWRIGYRSIDNPSGIEDFKKDPAIECFLLHGRAQSSGLNLVNASHVFLCEPVLNTAIELQAIARVDRIGQKHETTVWLYLIEGTVEESIYNLSLRRRLEHMGKARGKTRDSTPEVLDSTLEAANTLEMEQASLSKLMSKDRTAGEAVKQEDLWECLFGHVARAREAGQNALENPAVMGFLAAEAAEERAREGEGMSG
ncbi:E3 ubiquitin-protein ligase [Plectosphaerella plurivora]|uniref:E3 ubiquitin-protein ligase n=1 Tax=Plectosphaerella plurivora TaxID=936078 RepID=A0A9P8VFK6_9PEZI|nr:E3 ubiquitin-protein ligase [Plectosphaerella plurivora]